MLAKKKSAIALRSDDIRKVRSIATASGGGVANLSHDLFLFYEIIKQKIGFILRLSRELNNIFYTPDFTMESSLSDVIFCWCFVSTARQRILFVCF